jgi:general secretion pathway protein A
MYESHFGLKENPFNLSPDPAYLYMSEGHENAHTHLEYAVMESKGFVVMTGEIGSGKTTLLNLFLNEITEEYQVGLINQTFVTPIQFLRKTCREFELDIDTNDKESMVEKIHEFLVDNYAKGKRVILIIDEAQNLPFKTLEELRMLSNLESEKDNLIQIILVGQPELKFKLKKKKLEQFAQRVTVHSHIDALSSQEVKGYIQYRLKVAGVKRANIFTDGAIGEIAKVSKGIPRMINIICDASMVYAFADNKDFINKNIVNDVVRERAAGGLLLEDSDSKDAQAPLDDVPDNRELQTRVVAPYSNERFLRLEEQLQNQDEKLRQLQQEIFSLQNLYNERDTLIIELFKLLHKSMKGRYFLLKGAESKLPEHLQTDKKPKTIKKTISS